MSSSYVSYVKYCWHNKFVEMAHEAVRIFACNNIHSISFSKSAKQFTHSRFKSSFRRAEGAVEGISRRKWCDAAARKFFDRGTCAVTEW